MKPALGTNVADFGSGYDGPRYWKDSDGLVHLRGGVGFTGSVSSGGTLLTLPSGFRPGFASSFIAPSSSGAVRIDVTTAGVVSCNGTAFTTGGFVSLSGIYFGAEG